MISMLRFPNEFSKVTKVSENIAVSQSLGKPCFTSAKNGTSHGIKSLTRREIGVVRGTTDDGGNRPGPHETVIPGSVVPITSRWCKESCSDTGADESPQGTGVRLGNPDRKGPLLCLELGCFFWSDTMSAKIRWVEITDPVEIEAMREDIGAPHVYERDGRYWALADEVRAWREFEHKAAVAIGNGAG
jgi:hypothetical protein